MSATLLSLACTRELEEGPLPLALELPQGRAELAPRLRRWINCLAIDPNDERCSRTRLISVSLLFGFEYLRFLACLF